MDETIRVLHVDDDPNVTELTASFLERVDDALDVVTATSAADGLDVLERDRIDCVVSDYQMPGMDGFDFLEAVREDYPGLPFILFTGKGSEEIASEAISAGVTDYLQKANGNTKYELLANRIVNAVEQYRGGNGNTVSGGRQRPSVSDAAVREALTSLVGMYAVLRASSGDAVVSEGGDAVTSEDDGAVVADCNEAFADRLGYDRADLRGEPVSALLPDDGEDREPAVVDHVSGEDGSWGEVTLVTAAGERVPLRYRSCPDADALVTGGTLVAFDEPTERRALESEIQFYEELVNTVPDAIYALDEDMHYLYVNEGMADLTGYDREEIIGAHKSLVNTDESVQSGRLKRQELRDRDPDGMKIGFHPHVTADGEEIPTEVRFRALPTEDDEAFRGTAGVIRDVTDRLERQNELERQNRRLDEFASVVSHDLRNPLNVAVGRVELARRNCDCGGVEGHLATVDSELDRMDDIIEDVLTFARHGEAVTDAESVSIPTVARDAWASVSDDVQRLELPDDFAIRANRLRLQRLFENLFRNAVEHAGEDVTVRVGALEDPTGADSGEGIGFFVEDDGPGIPPDERTQVLEPGVTSVSDGTGFGLAIVKTITESHGWSLDVTEGLDGGARFEVTGAEPAGVSDGAVGSAGAS